MSQVLQRAFRIAVFFIGLAGPGLAASGPEAAPDTAPAPVSLLHLPSFGLAGNLTQGTTETFTDWAKKAVSETISEASVSLLIKDTDPKTVDMTSLKDLPKTSGSRTAELLAPICEKFNSEGALLFWLEEGPQEASFQMVSLLYLPGKIQLEQFQVSANFERQPIKLTEGKIQPENFNESIRATMLRNLGRIVAPEPLPAEAANDLAPNPGDSAATPPQANDLAPKLKSEANDLAPKPEGASGQQGGQGGGSGQRPGSNGETARPAAGGAGVKVGVLPFSLELSRREEDVRQAYGSVPSPEKLRQTAFAALQNETLTQPSRLDESLPITYKQMVAPVISLVGSDPRAKERRFARQCQQSGVDALMFGHLHEEKGEGRHEVTAYLRIFDQRRMKVYTTSAPWSASGMDARLSDLVRDVAREAGFPLVAAGRDVLLFIAQKGDWLSVIARKCYGNKSAYRLLGQFNQIEKESINDIEVGQVIKIPKTLGNFVRISPPCTTRRASS